MSFEISVIVLSFNYEKYIKDNLFCLLNQSDKEFEIIVVDDGSSDNSYDVINSIIASNESSIRVSLYQHENHENKGIIESYKFALSKCNCDYVAFCEADDYWHRDYIKNLKLTIKETSAPFIACKVSCLNQSSNNKYDEYVNYCNERLKIFSSSNKSIFRCLLKENTIPTFSSVCVRKDVILSCDFNSVYAPYLDFWLWRQIAIKNNIVFSENSVCYWRKHDSSYDMVSHLSELQDFFIANNELLLTKYNYFIIFKLLLRFVKQHFSKKIYIKVQNKLLKHINNIFLSK